MTKLYFVLSLLGFCACPQSVWAQNGTSCSADFDSSKVGSAFYSGYGFMPVMDSINGSSDSIHFSWLVNGSAISNYYYFTYVFPSGSNVVCLKVSTTNGCEAEVCKIVFVPRVDSCPLNASFDYLADSSDLLRLAFNPSPASDSLTYYWDFGDGGSSTQEFPTHAYAHSGAYTGSLTIKNIGDGGCASISNSPVYVNDWAQDPCSAVSFKYSVNPEMPDKWTFTIISDQPVPADSIQWWVSKSQPFDSVGSMNSSVIQAYIQKINPMTFIFPDTGYYTITLSVGPYNGCHQYPYKVIHVDSLVAVSGSSINTYPNPVVNQANFTLTLPDNTSLSIAVFNTMGGQVLYKNLAGMKGKNNITLSVYDLQPGIYYVGIWYNGGIKTSKFQKL